MRRTDLFLIFSLAATTAVAAPTAPQPSSEKAWLVLKPIQCLDNPWEKDWLEQNKAKKNAVFPRTEEAKIVQAYFAKLGVMVWEVRRKNQGAMASCQSCDCPRGDTLYLSVNASDTAHLRELGYDLIVPAKIIQKK